MRGIAAVKPGATTGDIGHAIQTFAEAAAHERGARLLRPRPRPAVPRRAEHPAFRPARAKACVLKPGMFFTIEPMINLGRPHVKILSDGWTAVTRDRSLSAQFEHSVGVTETGGEIFTLSPRQARQAAYSAAASGCAGPDPMRSTATFASDDHTPGDVMRRGARRPCDRARRQAADAAPHYHGHRERLRARFREAGADALTRLRTAGAGAVPRHPAAGHQAARQGADRAFGSFAEVLAAPAERLPEVEGLGEVAVTELKIVQRRRAALARGAGAQAAVLVVLVDRDRLLPHRHGLRREASSSASCSSTSATS